MTQPDMSPGLDTNLINAYYNSFGERFRRCLYPGMTCTRNPIRAHSIQNSRVFDLLQEKDHLIGLKIDTDKEHKPHINFELIGRNRASTFEGLCESHDKELFHYIDDFSFNKKDQRQLFLIAYRSVLKELHASMAKALMLQNAYLKKKNLKHITEGITTEGLISVQGMVDSYETFNYKNIFDEIYLNGNYELVFHWIFEIETQQPTIACSQLFSIDSAKFKDSVPRMVMNIFPVHNNLSYGIFTCTKEEREFGFDYLYKCINSTSYAKYYEISKLVIRNSENFFINPKHYNNWSESKKKNIINYFVNTLYKDNDLDNIDYYLF